ncbi:hypothetical protein [Pseudalkalibacillus hwajinpoensis]|uniref:hypothetical protein n=1 Tax=Guptibacillus hwajinpoensis TaxID=208199 RepID=UPI001CFD7474|nr:hypothetical protein [Pseudalkalibacillus hwajinpoensis]
MVGEVKILLTVQLPIGDYFSYLLTGIVEQEPTFSQTPAFYKKECISHDEQSTFLRLEDTQILY